MAARALGYLARAGMRFSYYERLSSRDQATYRKSDQIGAVALAQPELLRPQVDALDRALASGERRAVHAAAQALSDGVLARLGQSVRGAEVRVLSVRPSTSDSDLHGLYEELDDGRAVIRVWMKTAAHQRVVRFRTFLRTLLHELCHHLDYALFGLEDSFHTQGFFRRESSLARQLLGPAKKQPAKQRTEPAAPKRRKKPVRQLELPLATTPESPAENTAEKKRA